MKKEIISVSYNMFKDMSIVGCSYFIVDGDKKFVLKSFDDKKQRFEFAPEQGDIKPFYVDASYGINIVVRHVNKVLFEVRPKHYTPYMTSEKQQATFNSHI